MPPARATVTLAQDLRTSVGRLIRKLRSEIDGPPMPQLTVLGRLERDGPQSVSQLAAAERVRPQSMAQTVGDLERAGLVSRRPDPDDGRRAFVELTDSGRATILDSRARREGWLANVLDRDLNADERALLKDALALLERIAAAD